MHIAINAYFWNRPFVGSGQYTRQIVYHLNRLVTDIEITLIFPQIAGEPDPEDVPHEIKKSMKFQFVDTVDEVLDLALEPLRKTKKLKATATKKSTPKKAKPNAKNSARRR